MQESRYVTEINFFFYKSLNIDKAVSPYQVWNKVKGQVHLMDTWSLKALSNENRDGSKLDSIG
jgi:hypothetical protein